MINITIDGKSVQVPEGNTILEAAESVGIRIPTLCFMKDLSPITSCMLCIVKIEGRKNYLPACAAIAEEGMVVFNDDPDITLARKTALELLLSDHAGDCMGPCQVACPAGMNIPEMIRHTAAGRYDKAVETIKEHLALPAVTGYICPAPCEKACRRGQIDESIAVRMIKRCAAEIGLEEGNSCSPVLSSDMNKKVAVIGAGPAGLSTAYYLQREGVSCTVFDDNEKPGGMLRYGVTEEALPRTVLDAEIEQIRKLGVVFRQQIRIGRDMSIEDLLKSFDAVFLGTGKTSSADFDMPGLKDAKGSMDVNPDTLQTGIPGVFAGGDVRKGLKLTVRSLADGKKAAESIIQYLNKEHVTGTGRPFNTRMGKLDSGELVRFAASPETGGRGEEVDLVKGMNSRQASRESSFCLHCDCRKPSSCRLRLFAQEYGAKTSQYRGKRRLFIRRDEHPDIIYEPGKCISCGICVRITEEKKEDLGLAFIGRGFDVRVAVPFDKPVAEGLSKTAEEVVKACPTGSLAFKEKRGI